MQKKMRKVLSEEPEFKEYYISKPIKATLLKSKYHVLHRDWDRVFIIDGEEGAGKSLLALQLGYFLDRNLNLDKIVFSGVDFTEAIKKAKKGDCIIFDEAFNGLSSVGAMSFLNKLIVKNLQECRQKNLFIIIVLPTIFMLQKYVAIFRSRCLFHVYSTNKGGRGYYRIYNRKNKRILYLSGKKLYSYKYPYLKKSYRFHGKYPIDEKEYRKMKLESLRAEKDDGKYVSGKKWEVQRNALIVYLKKKHKMKYKDIAEITKNTEYPLSENQIGGICRENTQKHDS